MKMILQEKSGLLAEDRFHGRLPKVGERGVCTQNRYGFKAEPALNPMIFESVVS
jgi:hypothetical protein